MLCKEAAVRDAEKPTSRNHPADKQTLPQYKAKKPDATATPNDARPAAPTHNGQSRTTQDHHPTTTACHTTEDRTQRRAPKAKANTAQMRPHRPAKNKAPLQKCTSK
ncbi:hypothetical protein CRENBAI_025886 [Crenichthys baileyi]|uniref:Uncharacterized protein n=1 Tax=Crenichthys baileyi TaxID=28760 RepID=A0AAV9RVZ4_9TELE